RADSSRTNAPIDETEARAIGRRRNALLAEAIPPRAEGAVWVPEARPGRWQTDAARWQWRRRRARQEAIALLADRSKTAKARCPVRGRVTVEALAGLKIAATDRRTGALGAAAALTDTPRTSAPIDEAIRGADRRVRRWRRAEAA